jgi:Secretion system C-terminal sorting domain
MTFKYLQKDYYKPVSTELNSSNMGYIENRGQVRNSNGTSNTALRFYNDKSSPSTYIDDAKIGYVWNKSADTSNTDTLFRVDMQFNKGNTGKKVYPLDFKSEYYNFYLKPLTVGKERTLACNSVVKFDAYTNTDIIFTHNRKGYKTYIVARSGAPTANFEMQYTGQSSLTVNGTGQLVIGTSIGSKIQPKAKAYTMNSTTGVLTLLGWQPTYIITGGNKVSFTYGTWPAGSTLVIEMEKADGNGIQGIQAIQNVDWSTFFGGDSNDENYDVANTIDNKVYTCGYTISDVYAQTTGFVLIQFTQTQDAFICKFDELCRPKWFNFYGDNGAEIAQAINIDDVGDINIVGFTTSASINYYTLGFNINDNNGGFDGFYARFNSDGFITTDFLIGGTGDDDIRAITSAPEIDGTLIYIAGASEDEADFPVQTYTGGYNQSTVVGGFEDLDSFILMYNTATSAIEWCTFYGGKFIDRIDDIAIKNSGTSKNLVVTGVTKSFNYASANSDNPLCDVPLDGEFPDCYSGNMFHQSNYIVNNNYGNHFIAEFDGLNHKLVWGTYFGATCAEMGAGVQNSIVSSPDGINDVNVVTYITGCVDAANFPTFQSDNPNSFNDLSAPSWSGFIAKFGNENNLKWSSFIESGSSVWGSALALNNNGNVFLTGQTIALNVQDEMDYCTTPTSNDFPICDYNGSFYLETNLLGGPRTFITGFNKYDQLTWSTLYGQVGNNFGYGLSASDDKLFLVGKTSNLFTLAEYDDMTPFDYYQEANAGFKDGIIARFSINEIFTNIKEETNTKKVVFSFYPNPATQKITIENINFFKENDVLKVTNAIGQIVKQIKIQKNTKSLNLDVSKLASGVFTVQLLSNNTSTSLKFIKE